MIPANAKVAPNVGPKALRAGLMAAALAYFAVLIADHERMKNLRALVPAPVLFFAQIADLFPDASAGIVEYRAEGWLCGEHRFAEIDMDTLFPMLAGNKENRFYRLMHFYRQSGKVLAAFDNWCVKRYPPVAAAGGPERIGGVRLSSIILPLPKDGGEVERYVRKPLSEIENAQGTRATEWYRTPEARLEQRCAEPVPAP